MKTTATTNTYGFRAVLRGTNAKGEYKRAVRTVQAKDYSAAAGFVAENGEKLAKGIGFKPTYISIFPPLTTAK